MLCGDWLTFRAEIFQSLERGILGNTHGKHTWDQMLIVCTGAAWIVFCQCLESPGCWGEGGASAWRAPGCWGEGEAVRKAESAEGAGTLWAGSRKAPLLCLPLRD